MQGRRKAKRDGRAGRAWLAPKGWTTSAVNAGEPESGLGVLRGAGFFGRRAWHSEAPSKVRVFVHAALGVYNSFMGDSRVNLTHHFLIAMPSMADPHFAHTLIYVCEHNAKGALGIVVNKPIDMTLSSLFEQINVPLGDSELREARVHYGGPVQIDRGFVLHRPLGSWQSTLAISDDLGLTTSKDILEAVGHGEGPENVLISLGYAGWSADQLEQEIGQNAWLTVAADSDVLFAEPAETRLPAAMKLLGIDFSRLSDAVGHA